MNFIIFLASYILIIISVVGYGQIIEYLFFNNKKEKINIGYLGLQGLFFLTIYSYFSSFFIAHDIIHNSILILLGVIFFLINFKFLFIENRKEFYIFFLVFLILFIGSLAFKTNEDFPFYHFNYTMIIVERPSVLGMGVFNHGFRTPSSIFYINSFFYLPFIKYYSFHMAAVMFMGFGNLILIKKIIFFITKNCSSFIAYLSLLSFVFINVVFYRIAEHGTDRSAQILIFILIIEILIIINFFELEKYQKRIKNILILTGIVISLKAFYLLYLILIIYLTFFLLQKVTLNKIIRDNFFIISSFLFIIFLIFLINLQNSGCFLYPVTFTCLVNLPWSINSSEISFMSDYYEFWAKGGAGPGFKVEMEQALYIKNFNWVKNWLVVYFAEKGINTTLGTIFISLIVYLTFFSKSKKQTENIRSYKIIFAIIFLLFIEWFVKHPAFRYGGFCLLALLIYLPVSILLEKFDQKDLKKKFISLIIITIFIFVGRNVSRLTQEIKKYNYKPLTNTFYYIGINTGENYLLPNNQISTIIESFEKCRRVNNNDKCKKIKEKIGLFYNKYFFKKI